MMLIFALSALGIRGTLGHQEYSEKPMGADDWSSESSIGKILLFLFYYILNFKLGIQQN